MTAELVIKKLFDETFHKGDIIRVNEEKFIVVSIQNYVEKGIPKTRLELKRLEE